MPYLKVEAGGSVVVEIVDGLVRDRLVHWVGNRSMDCAGDDCQWCAAGISVSARYQLDTKKGITALTWEFSNTVRQQLQDLAGDIKTLAGKLLKIQRHGKGLQTQYLLSILGEGDDLPEPELASITPQVSVVLDALDHVLCDGRFAALLGEHLGQSASKEREEDLPY